MTPHQTADAHLRVHDVLGRTVRTGTLEELAVPTIDVVLDAIADERWEDVIAFADFFVAEARIVHNLYQAWIAELRSILAEDGVREPDLETFAGETAALLTLPDGRAYDSAAQWERVLAKLSAVVQAAQDGRQTDAAAHAEKMRELWRQGHDRDVDCITAFLARLVARLGESALGPIYDRLMADYFAERYALFDVDRHPWSTSAELLVGLTAESMRSHLSGPGRRGTFEARELGDRWEFRFDPCGSGGRTIRGDDIERTPARTEPPYEWPVTKEPASWNHQRPGVCLYCAHCIVLTEEMSVNAFGYPTRAIDPPRPGDIDRETGGPAKCMWTVFKDPSAVPVEYYERLGRKRPDAVGSKAVGGQPTRRPLRLRGHDGTG